LGLDKVADAKIGTVFIRGLSGGEKRRASIGVEIVTSPVIIFLDEPTSGLDSEAAHKVVELLVKLTKSKNCTVIATIHQPSAKTLHLFDKLLLLVDGKTAYFGPTKTAKRYFAKLGYKCTNKYENPGDFFLTLLNIDFAKREGGEIELAKTAEVNDIIEKWNNSKEKQNLLNEVTKITKNYDVMPIVRPKTKAVFASGKFATSLGYQTWVLFTRSWVNSYRDLGIYWVRVVMYLMMVNIIACHFDAIKICVVC